MPETNRERKEEKASQLIIKPQAKQLEALKVLKVTPVVFYGGAKGGGKSWLVRAWMVLRRMKYPGTKGVIIRRTFPELNENHILKMWAEYPILRKYYNKADKMIEFPNGSILSFKFLQYPDDVYNYQGIEYDDFALDECTQHPETTFKILRSSQRSPSGGIEPRFLLTGNPGGVGHGWVKRLFINKHFKEEETEEEFGFVQAKVWDNDILMQNDPSYIRKLEALPEEKRRAYLDGDWDIFEGQFFSEWRQEKHVIQPRYKLEEAPNNFDYRLCWDEGTSKPRAVYIMAQDNDAKVEVIWEYYLKGENAIDAARNIKRQLIKEKIHTILKDVGLFIYDPSMDIKNNQTGIATSDLVSRILEIRKQPGNNNRIEGARRFKDYLHWDKHSDPLLQVWSTCRNLIITIPDLVYAANGMEDLNTDGDDHAYDAVRYGLMSFTRIPERFKGEGFKTGIIRSKKRRSMWER